MPIVLSDDGRTTTRNRPAAHSTYRIPSYARSQPTSRPELYEFILVKLTLGSTVQWAETPAIQGSHGVPEHGSPSVRRRRLAAELRRLRERAGFTGEQVAQRQGWSVSKLSRIETSKVGVKQDDLRPLLDLYGVTEPHRSRVLALARGPTKPASVDNTDIAAYPPGYAGFAYAEADAVSIWNWEPQVVPGLLQTESYAREVMRGWFTMFRLPPARLEARVVARMARQQILTRDQPPNFSAIIDESST